MQVSPRPSRETCLLACLPTVYLQKLETPKERWETKSKLRDS